MPPKHPSPTSKPRWAQRTAPASRPSLKPKLSIADTEWLKSEMHRKYGWNSDPRPFQIDAIRAQLEGRDIIIQAPTGAGKTAIAAGPHLWPTSAGKTTLMVCPLLALEEEMEATFADEFGLKAKAVNSAGGKLTQKVVKELLAGTYQIVLISPEILQSPAFISRVLRQPAFSRRILSLVIDEAHCISHWGADFRKKYSTLGSIRAYLPRGTSCVAETATLTARVRRDLHRVLHFSRGQSQFTNVGNDRPNVTMVVRAIEHPQHTFADLDFLIPSSVHHPSDIPKSYVYVEDIKVGNDIIDHLNELLAARAATTLSIEGLIRPYNATLPSEYHTDAMAAFRAVPAESGLQPNGQQCIRILVCTDAAGMGCNVKDIARVVQWKLPKTLSNFVQRAGRAARASDLTGLAVLLVERSVYSLDLRPSGLFAAQPPSATTQSKKKSKPRATASLPRGYAQRHGVDRRSSSGSQDAVPVVPPEELPHLKEDADDEGLRVFVQANTCRRQICSKIFENPFTPKPAPGVPCCDICDPTVFNMTRPGTLPISERSKVKLRAKGLPDYHAFTRLDEWRETVFRRDLATSPLDPTAVLNDDIITHLVSVGPLTAPQVSSILQESWIWWKKYGNELTVLICGLKIDYHPIKKTRAAATVQPPSSASMTAPRIPIAAPLPPNRLSYTHPIPPTLPKRALDIEDIMSHPPTVPHPGLANLAPSHVRDQPNTYHPKRARLEPASTSATPPHFTQHIPMVQGTYPPDHRSTTGHGGHHVERAAVTSTAVHAPPPHSAYSSVMTHHTVHPSSTQFPDIPTATLSAQDYAWHMSRHPMLPPPLPRQEFPIAPSDAAQTASSIYYRASPGQAASPASAALESSAYTRTSFAYPASAYQWPGATSGNPAQTLAAAYRSSPSQPWPEFPGNTSWGASSTAPAAQAMHFQFEVASDTRQLHPEYVYQEPESEENPTWDTYHQEHYQ